MWAALSVMIRLFLLQMPVGELSTQFNNLALNIVSLSNKRGFQMKTTLLVGMLLTGLMASVQAYTVQNNLGAKSIKLNNFCYFTYPGASCTPQDGFQILEPGE